MSSTDDFVADTTPELMFPFYHHPLSAYDYSSSYILQEKAYCCFMCVYSLFDKEPMLLPDIDYHCTECGLNMHKKCIKRLFLNWPFLCNHVLNIFQNTFTSSDNIDDFSCHFCQSRIKSSFARFTLCNINVDEKCMVELQPPLKISEPKHHKYSLTILLWLVTFICSPCGVEGDHNPYVCLECSLMVHRDCIEDLPRVISINRHDHLISHTFHLGEREGGWECGVCQTMINWVYGAYKCSRCPSYVVHSGCATKKEVWDGLDLEDVPDEEEEIKDPFKVINENGDIVHISHEEHVLRLDENYVTDDANMRCQCCILAINGDPCYRCVECDFILHDACANLPRKKQHLLHKHKLTLSSTCIDGETYCQCKAYDVYTDGFIYKCHHEDCESKYINYDARCSSVLEPFHHDLHQHPLYFTLQSSRRCQACDREIHDDPLNCTVCDDYSLFMRCATLPRKVKHRCDDHFLSLCQGVGNAIGDLWCDICETKTN
ncbi:putative kinase C-like, phorbol ester/diacylglycerol-binding protein [Arabidopsis thaliana]|uniref:Phorbol-ester/DAG-type domain-containing protein n=2 Tax=Arabidopsis TaxID=3701 RepID=A0A178U6X7_ARATH|nr:DC1 [Arabidopsis thaliana x Arabidopsis arenosa]OAO89658.1 hypothetical protein AXX17_AT5G29880 [Arabidopsis thaliana]